MPEHGQDGPPHGAEVRRATQRFPSWATPDEGDRTREEPTTQQFQPPPPQHYGPPPQQYGQPRPYGQPWYGPPQPHHGPPGQPWYGQPGPYGHPRYGQPPYGQPPYGRPPYGQQQYEPGRPWTAPTPFGPAGDAGPAHEGPGNRRRWIVLVAVAVVVVAAGITALLLLTQDGGDRVLSRSAVQRDVAQQFQQKQGVSVKLTCTDTMTLVDGATYHCTGVTGEGESVRITLKVTDAKAATYTWTDR